MSPDIAGFEFDLKNSVNILWVVCYMRIGWGGAKTRSVRGPCLQKFASERVRV
jgi:hypothetical protein